MDIRQANENDIPEIIKLLKASLGESLMPKSATYWRWKHFENPFGRSPVLLGVENDQLVGVRAFMRWKWEMNGDVFHAVRAVDTATHPDHQGKGIFKKLTLALVELCKINGDHFIFNTPNKQSEPGYLKMGWERAGNLPIITSVQRPISIIKNYLLNGGPSEIMTSNSVERYLIHPGLDSLLHTISSGKMTTSWSAEYLRWRYLRVPVASYVAIGDTTGNELKGLLIARIKKSRFGPELRITDVFCEGNVIGKHLLEQLDERKKHWGINYTTITGNTATQMRIVAGKINLKLSIGPMVTVRNVNFAYLSTFQHFKGWSPSLGDLELF